MLDYVLHVTVYPGSSIHDLYGPGLFIRIVRDLATLNYDPGRDFWAALDGYLLSLARATSSGELLSIGHVGSLATSLAVLGLPTGSEALLARLLPMALAAYPWDRGVAEQLDRATRLMEATAGRASPALLPLLSQLRARLDEMPTAPAAREASVLSSGLHLRIVDALVSLGLACQAEVQYMGLNLDVVVWPMGGAELRPLVLEVDGPSHFLDRDPSRPTGPTLSRRRLLSAPSSPFQGVVPLIWLDFTTASMQSSSGLIEVVERRVAEEQDGLSLAVYGHPSETAAGAERSWELAKRVAAASEAELLGLLCDGQVREGTHLAVLAQRLHAASRRQQGELSGGCRSLILERLVQGVRETSAVPMRVHCLALVLRCLAYCRQDISDLESIRASVFQRLVGDEAVFDQPPSWAAPTILESMSMLGWRLGCSRTPNDCVSASPQHWRRLVLSALRRAEDLEAAELVQLIASLGGLGASRLLITQDEQQEPLVSARLQDAFRILQGKVATLRPHQLVDLVRGILQLGVTISQPLEDAILKQAGAMAPSFSLDALAVVMIREPAIGDGETSLRARRKAVQSQLGSEIRWRLRAMNPPALLKSMERLLARQDDQGFTSVSRGFLVMWASEVFRRRSAFTREQRARVLKVMSTVQGVWDPGEGWRVKFVR